jgi:hypothetical protein
MPAKLNEVVLHAESIRSGLDNVILMSEALLTSLTTVNVTGLGGQSSGHLDGKDRVEKSVCDRCGSQD